MNSAAILLLKLRSLSFSQENTQFYKRRVASAKFGYLWRRADNKWRYNFDLIDLNYVLMPSVDSSFISELKMNISKVPIPTI